MRNQLIYDLPIRIFHWIFAGLFVFAFLIAKTVSDESPIFVYHMFAGLILGYIVLLRIVWGFIGTKHSRFSSFELNPKVLISYFTGIISGNKRKWAGHNPATSWAAIIMFIFTLGLGITGFLMTSGGDKDLYEDIHELFANGFLVFVLLHIAGIVLHSIRHRDNIALSMIDGNKGDIAKNDVIPNSKPIVGILFIALIAAFVIHLNRNFDSQAQTLNFFGTSLNLGEHEGHEHGSGKNKENESGEHETGDHDEDAD